MQAVEQLELNSFFKSFNWFEEKIQLTISQIVSRAIYPASENKSDDWIKENSSILDLKGYNTDILTKDKFYKNVLELQGSRI